MSFRFLHVSLAIVTAITLSPAWAAADSFTLTGPRDETIELEARLAGTDKRTSALELASGRYVLVPQAAIKGHVNGDDPTPLTVKEMDMELRQEFGEDHFFSHVAKPYVVGFILERPLSSKQQEIRAKSLLRKAYAFMKSVQGMFLKFTRSVRI